MQNHTISTTDSDQTQTFGQQIGTILIDTILKSLPPTQSEAFVIALHGDLGAGKTTLTQGIAAGLGVTQPVTSPTYTLINEYALSGDQLLVHVDSYRLADAQSNTPGKVEAAALGIGFDEILDDNRAILIIEWASYLADLLPADHLAITLAHVSIDSRQISCQANGPRSQAILDAFAS